VTARAAPVVEGDRLAPLDALRGFAVLGILVMNVQLFAMPNAAYMNPTAYGDLRGANWWTWLLSRVLADQKFMTIFSMLFGAGIVLMSSRVAARGDSPARLHYRRMSWLLLFGLAHAYLLWYGDILTLYALCGLLVYPARKLSPRALLALGVVVIAVGSGISLLGGWSFPTWSDADVADFAADWQPSAERLGRELAAYRGGWTMQMPLRAEAAFEFESFEVWVWGLWRAGGLMLLGMALFKLGVLDGRRSRAFYSALAVAGLLVGLPLIAYGVHRDLAARWDMRYSLFFGEQFNYWGSLLVGLAYVGLVMLACRAGALPRLTRRLEAVGRLAFTNYLLQTILCTAVFYGQGLGLFGRVPRIAQIGVVAFVWAVQLALSPVWLRHFQLGPFEWLWRALTYGAWPALRRRSPDLALPAAVAGH